MNGFKKAVFAATFAIAGFAASAHAALIGDVITLSGKLDGSTVSSADATIGTSLEFAGIATYLNFNFDQTKLTVTVNALPKNNSKKGTDNNDPYTFPIDLGSFVFTGFNDKIAELTVFKDSPKFNNFDANDIVLNKTDNSITLNFAGVRPQNDEATVIFNIVTSAGGPATSVPEPTTVALLGLGLLGVAASRRKSGKSANA